jgi:pimeloyl-ACP methyl ester carboxylesterase
VPEVASGEGAAECPVADTKLSFRPDLKETQMAEVKRGFVSIAEGQVHYRMAADAAAAGRPLVLFHASPGSSRMLVALLAELGKTRPVFATDTLGNGDSAPPGRTQPDIAYLADAHVRALDVLGLERVDVYGTHTGGCIACEVSIRHPDRVHRLILDGMSLYADGEREDMLENYALEVAPDLSGQYLMWAWHFVRDNYLFWPWYKRDALHVRSIGLPASADVLHDKLVEVLKAVRTYHLSYRAAISYRKDERLPLVRVPTLLACATNDMLLPYQDGVAALLAHARREVTPGVATPEALARTADLFARFLDEAA